MMNEQQRAAALAMLGQGAAGQAGQQLNPNSRQAQLSAMEQSAVNGTPMQQPQAPQQMPNPGVLQQLLMMLRGGGTPIQ